MPQNQPDQEQTPTEKKSPRMSVDAAAEMVAREDARQAAAVEADMERRKNSGYADTIGQANVDPDRVKEIHASWQKQQIAEARAAIERAKNNEHRS